MSQCAVKVDTVEQAKHYPGLSELPPVWIRIVPNLNPDQRPQDFLLPLFGIIGDEVQTLAAQDPGPADPLLPCLTLVSGGLPAEESYPAVVQSGHIAQGTPRHRAEATVMMHPKFRD